MGLFGKLVGKKGEEEFLPVRRAGSCRKKTIYCPVKGKVIPLEQVQDPVFASGMMGAGVGIEPGEGKLYAPVSGTVAMVFPTAHAIGLKTEDGMEVLIHIGIDTVTMKGDGFRAVVSVDQKVQAGDPLIRFDTDKIKKAGLAATTMVLISNADTVGAMTEPCLGEREVMEELVRFE